jgi:hypothetical protein
MKNSNEEMNGEKRFEFDFIGIVILGFIALQLYFFVGFIGISLGKWL